MHTSSTQSSTPQPDDTATTLLGEALAQGYVRHIFKDDATALRYWAHVLSCSKEKVHQAWIREDKIITHNFTAGQPIDLQVAQGVELSTIIRGRQKFTSDCTQFIRPIFFFTWESSTSVDGSSVKQISKVGVKASAGMPRYGDVEMDRAKLREYPLVSPEHKWCIVPAGSDPSSMSDKIVDVEVQWPGYTKPKRRYHAQKIVHDGYVTTSDMAELAIKAVGSLARNRNECGVEATKHGWKVVNQSKFDAIVREDAIALEDIIIVGVIPITTRKWVVILRLDRVPTAIPRRLTVSEEIWSNSN